MKTFQTLPIASLLALVFAFTAAAQGPQDREPGNRPNGMRPPPPPPEDIASDMLLEFDFDGDEKLDGLELEEAIAARHRPPTPEEIAVQWVEEFDADGSGELSPEELAGALEAHRPPQGPHGPRGNR